MIAVGAEIAQQDIQAFRLGNEYSGAQHVAHVERFFRVITQQVFCEQDAEHLVAVAFDCGKARVRGFKHHRQPFFNRLGDIDHVHLRARDHDVACRQVGDLKDAFDHRQRIGVDQIACMRVVQDFEQFDTAFRLGGNQCGQAFE